MPNHSAGRPSATVGPVPRIQLAVRNGQMLATPVRPSAVSVNPSATTNKPAGDVVAGPVHLEPFPLPPLPFSLIAWCENLARAVWQQHRRCLGIALFIEPATRQWSAHVPCQQCGAADVLARLGVASLPDRPAGAYLAGTFRSLRIDNPTDLPDHVPAIDGLHVLIHREPADPARYCYQCTAGEVHPIDSHRAIYPNAVTWLASLGDRLHLADNTS